MLFRCNALFICFCCLLSNFDTYALRENKNYVKCEHSPCKNGPNIRCCSIYSNIIPAIISRFVRWLRKKVISRGHACSVLCSLTFRKYNTQNNNFFGGCVFIRALKLTKIVRYYRCRTGPFSSVEKVTVILRKPLLSVPSTQDGSVHLNSVQTERQRACPAHNSQRGQSVHFYPTATAHC